MTTMLQEPGLRQRATGREPTTWPTPQGPSHSPARTIGSVLFDGLRSAGKMVLGWVLGAVSLVVQFVFYADAVLAVPLAPFLLPLLLLPVVLVFGLLIVGAGKVLAALGWL